MPIITNIGGGTLKEFNIIPTNIGGGTLKELSSIWTNIGGGTLKELHSPIPKNISTSWNGSNGAVFRFDTSYLTFSEMPWRNGVVSTITIPNDCTVKCTINVTLTDGYTYKSLGGQNELHHFAVVGVGEQVFNGAPRGTYAGTFVQSTMTTQFKLDSTTYSNTGTLSSGEYNIYAIRGATKATYNPQTQTYSYTCYPDNTLSMNYSITFERA